MKKERKKESIVVAFYVLQMQPGGTKIVKERIIHVEIRKNHKTHAPKTLGRILCVTFLAAF